MSQQLSQLGCSQRSWRSRSLPNATSTIRSLPPYRGSSASNSNSTYASPFSSNESPCSIPTRPIPHFTRRDLPLRPSSAHPILPSPSPFLVVCPTNTALLLPPDCQPSTPSVTSFTIPSFELPPQSTQSPNNRSSPLSHSSTVFSDTVQIQQNQAPNLNSIQQQLPRPPTYSDLLNIPKAFQFVLTLQSSRNHPWILPWTSQLYPWQI